VLALPACEQLAGGGMSCTTIGCTDGFLVDFSPTSGWAPGDYEIVVTVDGDVITCNGRLPLPGCDGGPALTCTPATDRVRVSESGCALPAAEHGFAGLEVFPPAARTVRLSISRNGSPLVDHAWTPAYTTVAPNGEDCPPSCQTASGTLVVPMTP